MPQHPSLKLLENALEQLESPHAQGQVMLKRHEIPAVSSALLEHLLASGLMKTVLGAPSCVECNADTEIQKAGGAYNAFCDTCGAVFTVHADESLEYQASIAALASWLCRLLQQDADPEQLDDGVYFLGHHLHGGMRYELHLMHGSTWSDAQSRQQVILQAIADTAIVLCLSRKFLPFRHRDIRTISLTSCLVYDGKEIRWRWPEGMFASGDSVKQYAAYNRVANEPRQQCKERLKEFLRKRIHSLFAGQMHPDIRQKIQNEHPEYLIYQDKHGSQQTLSEQMTLDAIKEVLREKGLSDQISGIRQSY